MQHCKNNARRDVIIIDIDTLVPKDHLLRKIEAVMDCEWIYERLNPYYCHDNGRPGIDPLVLIKMVLIQRLYGIHHCANHIDALTIQCLTAGF